MHSDSGLSARAVAAQDKTQRQQHVSALATELIEGVRVIMFTPFALKIHPVDVTDREEEEEDNHPQRSLYPT